MDKNTSIIELFRTFIIIRVVLIIGGLITFFGILIHVLEPANFPHFFDGIWWAIVTVFTVGYGDYVPKSNHGKTIAILLILSGTGFGAYYMAAFATELVNRQYAKQRGQATVSLTKHLIIVGWNERVKHVVSQYKTLYPNKDIVLIDETLPALPPDYSHLFFIKGAPIHDETMRRAGIATAQTIVITADKEKSEAEADTQSILTILTAKGLNERLHCIVEILTPHQIENAKRAGANDVVQANKLTSYALTASMLFPSSSSTFISLYNQITINKIQLIAPDTSQIGTTMRECRQQLLSQDILLLGIRRENHDYIHPAHPFSVQEGDFFIILKR
ncbi:MAG: TrkA family potassium uptake protein [Ectobacillus sp.]